VTIGVRTYIRSVPGEFNMDKNKVMELAQQQGCISAGAHWLIFIHVCWQKLVDTLLLLKEYSTWSSNHVCCLPLLRFFWIKECCDKVLSELLPSP
jgi:hypothetical protein